MKNNEITLKIIKKVVFIILFLAFWILNIIHIFKLNNGKEIIMTVFYIVIFLPITIAILFDHEVFSLFIIILYEIAMLLMGIFILSIGLASKEYGALDIIGNILEIMFSLLIVSSAIQYLRNKTHTLKIVTFIVGIMHLTIVIVSFILNGDFGFETWYDFSRNVIIILIFAIYIITFPYVQLKIFNDEK